MVNRRIRAKDLIADLRAGMDDAGLMDRYDLSPQLLVRAMTQLMWQGFIAPSELAQRKTLMESVMRRRQRRIVADEILQDIRAGNSEAELMEKFGLSRRGLQRVLERLVDSNLITHDEVCERSPSYATKARRREGRRYNRAYLTIPVPIYDAMSDAVGLLRDISGKGFRIAGIESQVGDVKTFQIPLDLFMQADPLLVVGECRWAKRRAGEREYVVAGFQITNFSETDEQGIRKLINWLLFTESGEWQTVR